MSTNFFGAMRLIVDAAATEADLPKQLFVLSDMQFNSASHGTSQQCLQAEIRGLFVAKGFSVASIPTIVYWNLNGDKSHFISEAHEHGVVCLSGFSQAILKSITLVPDLKAFLEGTPYSFLRAVLENRRYKLVREAAEKCLSSAQE